MHMGLVGRGLQSTGGCINLVLLQLVLRVNFQLPGSAASKDLDPGCSEADGVCILCSKLREETLSNAGGIASSEKCSFPVKLNKKQRRSAASPCCVPGAGCSLQWGTVPALLPSEEISALQLLPHQLNSLVAVAALTSAMTRTGSSHSRAWPPLDVVGFEGICSAQVLRHLQVPHCPVSELRKESGRRGG